MKLDKRYLTEIDLTARTTTGDPEGTSSTSTSRPTDDALEAPSTRLRGEVELPIPAASAVKIDGERAYRLHRKGVAVEMPTRVMRVHELELRLVRGRHRRPRPPRRLGHLRPLDRRRARRALRHAAPHRGQAVLRRGGRRARACCRVEEALPRLAAAR